MGKKNENNHHLFTHVTFYWGPLLLIGVLLFGAIGSLWALINAVAHGFIDYYTSRVTHKYWEKGVSCKNNQVKYNKKFVGPFWGVIGLDQLLHVIWLYSTYELVKVLI